MYINKHRYVDILGKYEKLWIYIYVYIYMYIYCIIMVGSSVSISIKGCTEEHWSPVGSFTRVSLQPVSLVDAVKLLKKWNPELVGHTGTGT
jgi:hypothetical protein